MIFKRREKPPFWSRVRQALSPRKGWSRGFRYISRRVQRLPDSPHRIALGFACGALASFTPFFTLHALVAALFAWVVRGNLIASIFGTIVGNPISFGLIAYICMSAGNWILGRLDGANNVDDLTFTYVFENPWEFYEIIFLPYLIGGIAPGLIAAAGSYVLLKPMIGRFQRRRRSVLAARARELVERRGLTIARRSARGGDDGGGPPPSDAGPEAGASEPLEPSDARGPRADAAERRGSAARLGSKVLPSDAAEAALRSALRAKRPRSAT